MRYFAGLFCILFFGVFGVALAQDDSSEFNISVLVGDDTEPPTTPTLLTATPISPTQVDLDWTVSTDNFILSGYIVERSIGSSSTSTIATTTLTSFSDTGLTASTSYSYSVRAFDSVGNYSTSSNMLTVTTPDYPVVSPTEPIPSGTVTRVVAEEVVITPDISSVTFDISSAFPARFEIRWGRTVDYELGFVSSDILRRDYTTILTDLEPGTQYDYQIIGYTSRGKGNVIDSGQFRTLDAIDLTAPANVRRFQAIPNGGDVNLSWQLPDEEISFVRIVRSHLGYPTNSNEGAVVYQGTGVGAIDKDVLFRYSPAYYTAFVYDVAGNISSGAITIAYADGVGPGELQNGASSREPLATTTERMPDPFDILIKQVDNEFTFSDINITLDQDEPFLIYLPVDKVTKNLKSIIVDLQDPTDQRKSFAFLLQLNKDRTAYEAIVSPLRVFGKSSLALSIYDFRSLRVAEYTTKVSFVEQRELSTAAEMRESDNTLMWLFLVSIGLLLLLLLGFLLFKRRDEDKEEDEQSKNAV